MASNAYEIQPNVPNNNTEFWEVMQPFLEQLCQGKICNLFNLMELKRCIQQFLGSYQLLSISYSDNVATIEASAQSDRCRIFTSRLHRFLNGHLAVLAQELNQCAKSEIIQKYVDRWNIFMTAAAEVADLCRGLNVTYLFGQMTNQKVGSFKQMFVLVWKEHVLEKLHSTLAQSIREYVDKLRLDGGSSSSAVFREIGQSFEAAREVRSSTELGRECFDDCADELLCKPYVSGVMHSVRDVELRMALCFLPERMMSYLESHLFAVLFETNKTQIDELFGAALAKGNAAVLQNLFAMSAFSRRMRDSFALLWRSYVERLTCTMFQRSQTVSEVALFEDFITRASECLRQNATLMVLYFGRDRQMMAALREGLWCSVMGYNVSKRCWTANDFAHRLSAYTDNLMRRWTSEETCPKRQLRDAMLVSWHCTCEHQTSDVLRRKMALRLLQWENVSLEHEHIFAALIEETMGTCIAFKFNEMLRDVDKNCHFWSERAASMLGLQNATGSIVSCSVVREGIWPMTVTKNFKLPPELQQLSVGLNASYKQKWNIDLQYDAFASSVDVKCNCFKKALTVRTNMVQASILFTFEKHDNVTIDELVRKVGLPRDLLLDSLSPFISMDILQIRRVHCKSRKGTTPKEKNGNGGKPEKYHRLLKKRVAPNMDSHFKLNKSQVVTLNKKFEWPTDTLHLTKCHGQRNRNVAVRLADDRAYALKQQFKALLFRELQIAVGHSMIEDEIQVRMHQEIGRISQCNMMIYEAARTELEEAKFVVCSTDSMGYRHVSLKKSCPD